MKTKCNKLKMEKSSLMLNFDNCFIVDSIGLSGGITLLQQQDFDVQIQSYTKWHISAIMKDSQYNSQVYIMGFYGHPEISKRESRWNLLRSLTPNSSIPWFCFRDFNEITSQSERWGIGYRPLSQMVKFQEAINYYALRCILTTIGQRFT